MSETVDVASTSATPRATTITAFAALVIIGGSNAVAVRFSNLELPPFWGAASRFLLAAAIFWVILLASRTALPRGKALIGSILYGVLAIGASYAFVYWGILRLQAGLVMVILSMSPLFTMFFAVAHRLERFQWRGLVGALIALAGIAMGVGAELGRSVPPASIAAVIVGAACMAEGSVVYKLFPGTNPLPTNVVALTTGGIILLVVSLIAGEPWSLPTATRTVVAFAYLVVVGSVVLFYLYLFVLSEWTASATSYAFLLCPIATIAIAALISGEHATPAFLLGACLALIGVWVGALGRPKPASSERVPTRPASESGDPPFPGCA